MSSNSVTEHGWTAVPANVQTVFEQANLSTKEAPAPTPVSSTPVPDTPLAQRIQKYAQSHLPQPTYHHSMRVYHYGLAIKRYLFPDWNFSDETWFLTCMFHDLGTTDHNLHATKLSFEFYGGYLALDVLRNDSGKENAVATQDQAESVAEAIIRHQDLRDLGTITAIGQLIQLATIFDNIGGNAQLVHDDTVKDVIEHYPRLKWSSCFSSTIAKELELKPWAHTTALGDFKGDILKNPYNKFE
ncbi:hypothetical protein BJY04DRAFT_219341 [Aspergillus karnatakaensis]|uniref:putative urea hydro-lyase/cyanamide hydratase n=1 Tax=Aspergillus karnatakaensis TaxID=1810916 RepID=UPI003CCD7741